ncbi:hypothetical protein PR202_gb00095 [Eleusine coracana subsp. coracana]|uniref:DNA-directed DNA polymerase family A palm domain-containing protein n=1 Tax=Eleusine coracana subsp. coracana TaxID=191504 RepID=A0AAV5DTC0_ELECO|nr:hypothetical protein PR202_gb00095 [Eleusine coracana subsp. coracana]
MADALHDLGCPVSDRILVLHVLRGLNAHYDLLRTWIPRQRPFPSFLQYLLVLAYEKAYVETLMGRRRFLAKIMAGNNKEKAKAQRQAVNSICQGSAADIIKVAMIKVHSVITNRSMEVDSTDEVIRNLSEITGHCHLILQVHDELVLEVDPCFTSSRNEATRDQWSSGIARDSLCRFL